MTGWQLFCVLMTAIAFLGTIGLAYVLRPVVDRQAQRAGDNARQVQIGNHGEEESDHSLPWETGPR